MIAIILAGGFAQRLMPLTRHIPKPLLPVAGKPVIDYIIDQLDQIAAVEKIIISTNQYFEVNFKYWLEGQSKRKKEIVLVSEPSCQEKEKLGAIAALQYVISSRELADQEIMILAGDNIFEFSLLEFLTVYQKHRRPVIALYDLSKRDPSELNRFGLGIIDANGRLVGFQEKPQIPRSTLAATGCYIYPVGIDQLINQYLADKNNPDAPGFFIEWLYKRIPVHAFVSDKTWYDIGSIESYDQVNQYFRTKENL